MTYTLSAPVAGPLLLPKRALALLLLAAIVAHAPAVAAQDPPPAPGAPAVETVDVRGERPPASRSGSMSREEVRQLPGAFGDPFRAIEVMPGVTPVFTGLPFFFVRGAPPGNVGYFLDGIRVPLLFHVGVGPSVIHPALIRRVDLYPGGYPARFGRFAGGIVSGETALARDEVHGEGNLRLFDAGAMVETPFADGRGHALVAGRYSYAGALLTLFSPDTSLDYWDYQARVGYKVTPDDELSVMAFGSHDFLGQKTPTENITLFGTDFHRVDLRHDRRLSRGGAIRTGVTLGEDRSRLRDDRFVRDRLVSARSEWTQPVSRKVTVRAGTNARADSYEVGLLTGVLPPSTANIAELFPSRTDLAVGVWADASFEVLPRLEVTPGVRTDLYASQGTAAVGVDPRLAMITEVTDKVRVRSAMGVAHQPPAFVVPVPGFQPGGIRGGLQKAVQESLGVEVDVASGTTFSLTGFHNGFFDMSDPLGAAPQETGGCPPGAFPAGSIAGDRVRDPTGTTRCLPRFPAGTIGPDRTGGGGQGAESNTSRRIEEVFEVRSRGRAFGLEVLLKRKLTKRLGGFVAYTLSRSTRATATRTYIASFDRTHVVHGALAFDLGKNVRAGARVTFYTGLPKAPDPTDDATRLPPFFRLDLRLEKRWRVGERAWISVVAEWLNATLSKEAVATTCTLAGCQSQLVGPVTIPSLGVEGAF